MCNVPEGHFLRHNAHVYFMSLKKTDKSLVRDSTHMYVLSSKIRAKSLVFVLLSFEDYSIGPNTVSGALQTLLCCLVGDLHDPC